MLDKETQLKDIENLVRGLREDFDTRFMDLKSQLNIAQEKATETITERPMLTLAVAFIAGIILGSALTKSRD
jgi:ElaB/YqjD/DUF883 family membrane-anchored ribosome-binding protein